VVAKKYEAILDSGLGLGRFQETIDGYVQVVVDGPTWFVFYRRKGFSKSNAIGSLRG